MNQAVTIRVRREPAYVLVTVAGEIDIATVPALHERLNLLAALGRAVVVDLDQVTFIDAAGLGALAGAARQAAAREASLYVVCSGCQTRRLFRLTRLDRTIPLARTLAEAAGALTAGPGTPASGGINPADIPGPQLAG
jgi:anti-sigma B factor antagonist